VSADRGGIEYVPENEIEVVGFGSERAIPRLDVGSSLTIVVLSQFIGDD
jgi:hypothetical protein